MQSSQQSPHAHWISGHATIRFWESRHPFSPFPSFGRFEPGRACRKSGISVRNISDLERGLRVSPRPETLRLLANGLGLAPDQRTRLLESARPETFADPPVLRANGPAESSPLWNASLPAPLTPLIGRERVLGEISALLSGQGARFTTLTGPGGVGKTRLAIEVVQRLTPSFADGVAFVALAAVTDPAFVSASIAEALGVPVSGGSLSTRLANVPCAAPASAGARQLRADPRGRPLGRGVALGRSPAIDTGHQPNPAPPFRRSTFIVFQGSMFPTLSTRPRNSNRTSPCDCSSIERGRSIRNSRFQQQIGRILRRFAGSFTEFRWRSNWPRPG